MTHHQLEALEALALIYLLLTLPVIGRAPFMKDETKTFCWARLATVTSTRLAVEAATKHFLRLGMKASMHHRMGAVTIPLHAFRVAQTKYVE